MTKLKIFFVIILFSLTGCEDYLDKSPDLGLTEEDVFREYESARGFLDQCYNDLTDIHNWKHPMRFSSVQSMADEMATIVNGSAAANVNTGAWLNKQNYSTVGSDDESIVGRAFTCMRVANKVIANIGMIPNITQEEHDGLLGQAYFFRAWCYFQVIQRWGGMPIFDKVFSPNDNMDLKRLTYHESSEWLISDLNKAIELLPDVWDDTQYGRATKGSAMGVKAMAALYAASPLMSNDIGSLNNNGYDVGWAERAAEYAHEAIEYVKNGTGGHRYRLMDGSEYNNVFYHENFASDESLWFRMDGDRRAPHNFRVLYLPKRFHHAGGKGKQASNYSNPTQNIVDMFEMANGYPITYPGSGYDPQDPYTSRDPRLTNNILVPGEEWGIDNTNNKLYMETYVGGKELNWVQSVPSTSTRMASGYACKKFIWPAFSGFTKGWRDYYVNSVYIRVAQLYLDYAEAMNEAYGPTADPKGYGMTAVDAINVIRNRVGMPDVLSIFTGSKKDFRKRIRNERAVELMFEGHRWHDLRRWMIAEEVFNEPIKGMRAHPKDANHASVADKSTLEFTYEVVPLTPEERIFTARNYWYPLPPDHVNNLYNLQQNPGW